MKFFNDLNNAGTIFWGTFFAAMVSAMVLKPFTGVTFAPSRASDPRQIPVGPYKSFDLNKVGYAPWQIFRMVFGHMVNAALLIVGYMGSYTELLNEQPELQRFSFNVIFISAVVGLVVHSQMYYERVRNGHQMSNWKAMLFCFVPQVVNVAQLMTFLDLLEEQCSDKVKADARYKVMVMLVQFSMVKSDRDSILHFLCEEP